MFNVGTIMLPSRMQPAKAYKLWRVQHVHGSKENNCSAKWHKDPVQACITCITCIACITCHMHHLHHLHHLHDLHHQKHH